MPTVDQLLVQIDASTELLRRELQRGDASVRDFSRKTEGYLGQLSGQFGTFGKYVKQALGVLGVTLSVQWAASFVQQTLQAMNALDDLAKQLNVSVEGFQRLQFAFSRAGVDAGRFQTALRQLNIRLGQMQSTGKGPLADVFEKLGIDPKSVKTAEDALLKMAANWQKAGNAAQQANIMRQAAGRGAEVLAPALAQGAEKLAEEMERAPVWTAHQTRAANDIVKAWGRLIDQGKRVTGVLVELAALGLEGLGVDELQDDARTAAEELEHLQRALELLKETATAPVAGAAVPFLGPLAPFLGPLLKLGKDIKVEDIEQRIEVLKRLVEQQKAAAALAEQGITNPFAVFQGPEAVPLNEEDVDRVERWHEQLKTAGERAAETAAELRRLNAAADGLSDEDLRRGLQSLAVTRPVSGLEVFQGAIRESAKWTAQFTTELERAEQVLQEMKVTAAITGAGWAEGAQVIAQQTAEVKRLAEAELAARTHHAPGAGMPDMQAAERALAEQIRVRTRSPLEEHYETLKDIDRLEASGIMKRQEAVAAREATLETIYDLTKMTTAELKELNAEQEEARKRQEAFGDAVASTFESRGMEALMSGDLGAGIRGFAKDLVELIFRITVLQPLADSLARTLSTLSGGTGGIVGLLTRGATSSSGQDLGALISQMAEGGSVVGGEPYLVGERGRELFVPNMSGRIISNEKLGGTTVVQNFYNQVGLPAQWDAQMIVVGQQAASAAYAAVTKRMEGRR